LGGGLAQLDLLEIDYLYANDIVRINNIDYVVQSVDDMGNSITILTNEDLTGSKVVYDPFVNVFFENKILITPF